MSVKVKKVTKVQAEKALAVVVAHYQKLGYTDADMTDLWLKMDWDWPSGGPTPTILWEGGPYGEYGGWAYTAADRVDGLNTDKVWVEPYAGYALCLYRQDA